MLQNKKENIVYLLGAGFSHAITEKRALLTKELGEQLRGVFSQSIETKYGFSPDNIELFLTKIDLELLGSQNAELAATRRALNDKIVGIFATKNLSNLNTRNSQVEATDTADRIADNLFRDGDTILTLNYDCYLENILLQKQKWSPHGGWGNIFMFSGEHRPLSKIEIFKLHGSINFILVAPLDSDDRNSGVFFNESKPMLKYIINCECFPGWHETSSWEGTIREYIVLPSYLKQFEFRGIVTLWRNAALKICEVDKLVIIGTSINDYDYHLKFLISLINKKTTIILIDPQASTIKDKLINAIPINPDCIQTKEQKIENVEIKEIASLIYDS